MERRIIWCEEKVNLADTKEKDRDNEHEKEEKPNRDNMRKCNNCGGLLVDI